jgi:hypothetical protein
MVPKVRLGFTEYCLFNFKIVTICGEIFLYAKPRSVRATSDSYFGTKVTYAAVIYTGVTSNGNLRENTCRGST